MNRRISMSRYAGINSHCALAAKVKKITVNDTISEIFFSYAHFARERNPGKVEAHYRQGVLHLKLPKTEESKGHRVTVKG